MTGFRTPPRPVPRLLPRTPPRILLAAALGLGAFAPAAMADCAAELDALANMPKGGAAAPMASGGATPQAGDTERSPEAAKTGAGKDGSLTPMGESPEVATSSQDAQAQSEGGETAAEQAMGGTDEGGASRQAAIDEARAALANGDEAGCAAALERAKSM